MYRLLALDIDDTITLEPGTVPGPILEAVDRARRAGIRVTLATGRGHFGSKRIIEQLAIAEPVINYGGAMICRPEDGAAIYGTEVPDELVHAVLADAEEMGIHAHIYQGDVVIYEKHSPYVEAYTAKLGLPGRMDGELRQKQWHGVPKVLMMTTEERAEELIPYFQRRYEGRLKVSGSSRGFIEFNNPSAHKGSGLEWLAGHLGIPREETVAVGDNSLDVEMIRWAGLGCAVENAREAAKAAADMIIPPCGEYGVAWLIDNILLKGQGV